MYAGKYYSYLWARAVANLIWKKLFNEDPFNRCKGDIYHHNMLAYGGGIHPLKLVKNVLGYEPSIDELVDAYYQEIVYIKNQQQYHDN
jgi:intermediate peptidase